MRVRARASSRPSSRPRSRCGRRPPRTPACAFCSWARWCCCRSSSNTQRMPTGCFAAKWMLRRTITERTRRGPHHRIRRNQICYGIAERGGPEIPAFAVAYFSAQTRWHSSAVSGVIAGLLTVLHSDHSMIQLAFAVVFFALSFNSAGAAAADKVAQLAKAAPKHCYECHDQQLIKGKITALAQNEEPEIAAPQTPPPATVGMRYPLYYDKALRGAEPSEMVLLPAGKFTMGTNERLSDEGPQHVVHLMSFYIDKYEVTNLQYKKFNRETGRRSTKHIRNRSS